MSERARDGKIKIGSGLALAAIALIGMLISLTLVSARTKSSGQEPERTKWGRRSPPVAGLVEVTPLGSHQGEFCRNDRALIFKDPTGVRILWDPGRTTHEADARLGEVHVLVLSSVHADHIGDSKPNPSGAGSCASPSVVSAAPNSNAAAIAAAENAAVFAGGEMADFLSKKIQNIRGVATASCPASGSDNELMVPLSAPCAGTLRPGGSRTVKLAGQSSGVRIATVAAVHSNGIPATLLDSPSVAPGTGGYGGNDGGAVLEFTNGLKIYLTADTGLMGDMETIIRRYYQPDLAIINIGDIFSLGPDEAAFAVNELLKPTSVIPEHINEEATVGGRPAGSRLLRFIEQVNRRTDVVIPLAGVTRAFDGKGRCVNCGGK